MTLAWKVAAKLGKHVEVLLESLADRDGDAVYIASVLSALDGELQ